MQSWRDLILKEFAPNIAKLTLVADPDGLLIEEGILEGIRERGFELISFEDSVAFRYAYESKFRSRWDHGEHTDLVVVLRSQESDLSTLPFDVLHAGRTLSFNLYDIFSNLSYPVVATLDRSYFDALFEAQRIHAPGKLGDNATRDFILRHVFEIAPELIKQPSDLLRMLLRRHYRDQRIPADLDTRLIHLLRQNRGFDKWPLEVLISDREAFFMFLQERWPIYLDRLETRETSYVRENESCYGFAIPGPAELPFDHDDVRGYIINLFVEGLLHSVPHERAEIVNRTWAAIGIRTNSLEDRIIRLDKLLRKLEESIPEATASHTEWFSYARSWAELLVMCHDDHGLSEEQTDKLSRLTERVDERFWQWIQRRFAGLIQLPPEPPAMVHHIARYLANAVFARHDVVPQQPAKVALLVIDGLSLDQWLLIRHALARKETTLRFREQEVFAWIPSLTSVSRQAIFAGKAPLFFPNSIRTTEKEPALWAQFWADQGLTNNEVVYLKGLGEGDVHDISEVLSHPKLRVAGLVVDKVDRILHGMAMGAAGMYDQVCQWAKQPYLSQLLNVLLDLGFQVYLTSDHGNIEAEGIGRPSEGAMADQRGERVRVYSDASLRKGVKERFPRAIEWGSVGLPDSYLALLAPPRQAFVQEKHRIVSHGGISIEELIVPFVKIERSAE